MSTTSEITHRLLLTGATILADQPEGLAFRELWPLILEREPGVEQEWDEVRSSDLYQMLAYCTGMKLGRGHLVYAAGTTEAATHVVRQAGIEIVCHALDLGRPAEELLVHLGDVAGRLAHHAPVTPHME